MPKEMERSVVSEAISRRKATAKGVLKAEDEVYEEEITGDREFSYNENDEELELKQKIEQLQIQKRNVEEKIERNKLLKDMQKKEKEKKRLKDLQSKKEMQRRKAEKLLKLIKRLKGETRTRERFCLQYLRLQQTRDIIDKLESVYGNVRSGESVLTEFYMARQKRDEGIAEWGIRLESIIQTAIQKGHIQDSQKDEMLKTRFWRQLYNEDLKNATRMYFETARTFEELRRKFRIEENEMKSALEKPIREEKRHALKRQTETHEQMTVLQDLVERIKQLETEICKTRETEYEDRRRYRNENRADTEYHRKDEEYSSREQ
ncbi:trichohyalin-like [Mercenaria mercenaria]|uniref:trichohyalin-like n=1 Tax=Mercenaria mercenaria TaxID=6596 RepID=UPI00234F4BDE|nr:trichohyalin-like [Mercenaria mercenaria]